jgi:hypothetical protein
MLLVQRKLSSSAKIYVVLKVLKREAFALAIKAGAGELLSFKAMNCHDV